MPIILIRHGEAESNIDPEIGSWHNPSLTMKGREQVSALATRLKETIGDSECKLYTSHRNRAVETALIIGGQLGITPTIETDLDEYRSGLSPDTTVTEAKKLWGEKCTPIKNWRPYTTGESVEESFNRARSAIEKIDAGDELVLAVSHSWLIDKMISYWIGFKIDELPPFIFRTSNASISVLNYREGDRIIDRFNDTMHQGEYLTS
ncbi:histidine phosphatase family protein [Candidatus Bathyarchaeota archaeon]|nr:histidine phosphatase family protein [Candidatus Bathyarchaeota archaeon]